MAKKKVAKKPARTAGSGSRPSRTTKASTKSSPAKSPTKKSSIKRKAARPASTKPASRPARKAEKTKAALPPEARLAEIDKQLLELMNERAAAYIEKMSEVAAAGRNAANDADTFRVLSMIDQANTGPLTPSELKTVFRPLLSAARQRVKSVRVAYLGPPYSFTHQAAINRFGELADLIPVSTIATVFEEVNRGHVDFGLVPIENSTDGRIVDTLDMFTRLPLRICGEVQINVHHNLLARCDRSEITEIYSKPQALSQCRDWLSKNMPQARLIEVTSTSTAAQLARDKPRAAAVASQQASVQYDVPVVAESIEDNRNNVTRFAVIGDTVAEPTGRDRTAILLQIPHKPGSLSDALEAFRRNKINLTWIESFPLRSPAKGYLFFLDFEGHISDTRIRKTLKDLENLPPDRLEVLGSYPRSEPEA
jgi:chorismate mutase/prephenate dehydratase